jgi:cellulose synthase/poly-beta-1,6-N-acetylglucosamine synthase-like glycosyltransferase
MESIEIIQSNVTFAILARDCSHSLQKNIPKIECLRKYFKSSQVVVVENDSKDNTKDILKKWALFSNGIFLLMNDYGIQTIPDISKHNPYPVTSEHRIEKMVKYRNMYMDFIRCQAIQPDYLGSAVKLSQPSIA